MNYTDWSSKQSDHEHSQQAFKAAGCLRIQDFGVISDFLANVNFRITA